MDRCICLTQVRGILLRALLCQALGNCPYHKYMYCIQHDFDLDTCMPQFHCKLTATPPTHHSSSLQMDLYSNVYAYKSLIHANSLYIININELINIIYYICELKFLAGHTSFFSKLHSDMALSPCSWNVMMIKATKMLTKKKGKTMKQTTQKMEVSIRKPGLGPWSSYVASTECFSTLKKKKTERTIKQYTNERDLYFKIELWSHSAKNLVTQSS